MATSPFGSFAAPPPPNPLTAINPLQDLIAGLQQGLQLRQLPQQIADQELQKRLNNALLAQKLADLQNPEAALRRKFTEQLAMEAAQKPDLGINMAPPGLAADTIYNPQAIKYTGNELENALRENLGMAVPSAEQLQPTTPISLFGVPTGLNLNPNIPIQAEQRDLKKDLDKAQKLSDIIQNREIDVANEKPVKSPFTPQQIVSLTDPKDVRFAVPDENGQPPEGYQFAKAMEVPMKPSERITALKEVRAVYDDLPAKMQVFGGGQIIGANQLKEDLDALLKPVKGDFSKLSPQALKTFVFRANNLNDPRSATLLKEAYEIANRAGIGDRFDAYVANLKKGADVPFSVAEDIYNIISQVQSSREERLIQALIPLKQDLDSLGKDLTSIGVPQEIQDEVIRRISNIQTPPTPVVEESFPSEEAARAAGKKKDDIIVLPKGRARLK